MTTELDGTGVTPLSGVGTALWYEPDADLPEPPASETVDADEERAAFEQARGRAHEELECERERVRERVGKNEAEVFDAHAQFLQDPQITDAVEEAIDDDLPAAHAVRRAFEDPIEQFEGMQGRMAERADDLRDVRDRLLRILAGGDRTDLADLPEGTVLLAERLAPSDTVQLDPERVVGFATVTGGRTSHAAIFARSLALPAVVGVGQGLRDIPAGEEVLVDGVKGTVTVDPATEARKRAARELDAEVRYEPAETSDGKGVEVAANLGTLAEVNAAVERGADGVGLLRTEFLFLDRETPPDEDEQYKAYTKVLSQFPENQVVVRTFDVGGDKPIPYLDQPAEENPFLGERGIRRSLGPDVDLFETQLRALLRAAESEHGDGLAVMFPLVATVEELDAALDCVETVAADLTAEGVLHEVPDLGAMVETPAATFMAGEFADRLDFLSVGTNDLTQYVMAADRENDHVADLHDPLHPPVLRAIRRTVKAGHERNAWVGMCGEMAGDPDLTELLVGLGLDELSMSAVTIPAVKATVSETDAGRAHALMDRALAAESREAVRDVLSDGGDEL
ncbi:phosphoenolpyruvate--protein phosphotransferase [halophilic archaeon]|nr:phosphoenolpyruvate--protein phosphotransferase [halophilic archaeon]